jgi:hypothetical protein
VTTTKVELIINLRTGVAIPLALRGRAGEVIELAADFRVSFCRSHALGHEPPFGAKRRTVARCRRGSRGPRATCLGLSDFVYWATPSTANARNFAY